MASALLLANVGNYAAAYADDMTLLEGNVKDYWVMGRGTNPNTSTVVSQALIPEFVGGVAIDKVVGSVATGIVTCDALSITQRAFAAPCIGRSVFGVGSAGVDTVNTAASDPYAFIFVASQVEYNTANPPAVLYAAATGVLTVTAKTGGGFTVTSTAGAGDEGKGYIFWIVNPNYS
jgi:hypothetical protein